MRYALCAAALGMAWLAGGMAYAQAPAPNPLDVVPDRMPFNIPYGTPITLARAQSAIEAVIAEAAKRGWPEDVAVVDPNGDLVAFERMDGAQLASIRIATHKARAAARYRRPTRVFEDAVQKMDFKYVLSLDGVIASRGGMPLVEDGKLIGAIGCSGATGSQDEVLCKVGVVAIGK